MSIWIKICGIRDVETARAVAALRPDAIGLNFYTRSPRVLTPEVAAEVVRILPATVMPVGVFVNHAPETVWSICDQVGLSTVQIHGDESPESIAELRDLDVIRAFRVGTENLHGVASQIKQFSDAGVRLTACLVDAHDAHLYGGTGRRAPWQAIAEGWRDDWPPLILAGGLTPENVAESVRIVQPWGVDVASGVESSPGVKDLERVAGFIAAARTART